MDNAVIILLLSCISIGIAFIITIIFVVKAFLKLDKQVNDSMSHGKQYFTVGCQEKTAIPTDLGEEELHDSFLVDFRYDRWINYDGGNMILNNPVVPGVAIQGSQEPHQGIIPHTIMVPTKPVDVLDELKVPPTNWSLNGIDQKIKMLKKKSAHIIQNYAKQEVEGLIHCLECRKKFESGIKVNISTDNGTDVLEITARDYFGKYDITSEEKIAEVLKRHNLKMGDPDIFIPELPDIAVERMDEFTSAVKAISDRKPRYFIIANHSDFQKKQDARDPILLGQSPFGFFYYIIGAWDSEMLYLPEL